jgi:outer membrane protein assembly factor BamE (lipoprotein component of BamABCDE complex)
VSRTRCLIMLVLAAAALGACSIGRDYVGNELRAEPAKVLAPGVTTISDVLAHFGAPDMIQRRRDQEIFVYRFVRGNTSSLELEEPVITGITFFTYTKRQEKSNRLTLFFDQSGTLESFGYSSGIDELDLL